MLRALKHYYNWDPQEKEWATSRDHQWNQIQVLLFDPKITLIECSICLCKTCGVDKRNETIDKLPYTYDQIEFHDENQIFVYDQDIFEVTFVQAIFFHLCLNPHLSLPFKIQHQHSEQYYYYQLKARRRSKNRICTNVVFGLVLVRSCFFKQEPYVNN